jgi:hypothetical protein
VYDDMLVKGLSVFEMVVLAGRLRSPAIQSMLGHPNSHPEDPSALSNELFKVGLDTGAHIPARKVGKMKCQIASGGEVFQILFGFLGFLGFLGLKVQEIDPFTMVLF